MEIVDQWIGQMAGWLGIPGEFGRAFAFLLLLLIADAILRFIVRRMRRGADATHNRWDDALAYAINPPASSLLWYLGLLLMLPLAGLVPTDSDMALSHLPLARKIGLIIILAWFMLRLVRGLESAQLDPEGRIKLDVDNTTTRALGRVARIVIVVSVVLVLLDNTGLDIGALLAAGGIGGLALGFAAKDLLANLFGGLNIFLNKPFAVGDWVRSPDRNIEGVIEEIGWRQTAIRKFDRRPLYVPNAVFTNIAVENPSRMTHRRINEVLGIRYDDVDKMPGIVEEVEALLRRHRDIDHGETILVYFNTFSSSSLDFFIYCFTRTTDWQEYHVIKQDVLLKIDAIVRAHGAEFAFPTSTVKVATAADMAGVGVGGNKENPHGPA